MSPQATTRRSVLRHSRLVNYTRIARRRGMKLRKSAEAVLKKPRPMKSGMRLRRFLEMDRRQT